MKSSLELCRSLILPINYEKIKVTVATSVRELEGTQQYSHAHMHVHTLTYTPHITPED